MNWEGQQGPVHYLKKKKKIIVRHHMYWVSQKVCLGFCKTFWKTLNELFAQSNTYKESGWGVAKSFFMGPQRPLSVS